MKGSQFHIRMSASVHQIINLSKEQEKGNIKSLLILNQSFVDSDASRPSSYS